MEILNSTIRNSNRIGLMGGTFDPIHWGHLVTAEEVRQEFCLDKVIFIPSGHPPHKKDYTVTDAEHRLMMTIIATVTNPFFATSRIEIDRLGPSYTIDTIEAFREMYKETKLFFITGADAVLEILSWKEPEQLLQKCEFIAATRPGYDLARADKRYLSRFHLIEVPAMAVSSTDIRWRVRNRRTVRYLVPEGVESYINKNKLYVEGDEP